VNIQDLKGEMAEYYGAKNSAGGEKMFWMGLIIGLFIGANVGLIVLSLLFASQKGSCDCQSYDSKFSEGSICGI
jgi:hypothetical protein